MKEDKCLEFIEEELKQGVEITPSVMKSLRTVAEGLLYERLYAVKYIKKRYEEEKAKYEEMIEKMKDNADVFIGIAVPRLLEARYEIKAARHEHVVGYMKIHIHPDAMQGRSGLHAVNDIPETYDIKNVFVELVNRHGTPIIYKGYTQNSTRHINVRKASEAMPFFSKRLYEICLGDMAGKEATPQNLKQIPRMLKLMNILSAYQHPDEAMELYNSGRKIGVV